MILKRFESNGLFRRIKVSRGAPVISHILFADNSYTF